MLRLGSRGPGAQEATKSRCVCVRKRLQAVASVRECRALLGIEKRRTILAFYDQPSKSVEGHRTGMGGFWLRNAEMSSLLDSRRVFASQKCQQSQGSGGVVVAKRRTVVTFGLAFRRLVSKVSTVTGIRGVVVAKRRTVVTFGLAFRRLVSKASTVTGIRGVVVAKRRTVVTVGLAFRRLVSKVSTVTGIRGVVVAKRRTVVTLDSRFVVASQNMKGERRGETREEGRQRAEERREK